MQTQTQNLDLEKIDWPASIPFFSIHLIAVIGVFFTPFNLQAFFWIIGMYYLRMFAITAGYHRYFSHRSYKTSRVFQFLIALLGTLSMQKGVLWWAANHRHHHRYSDLPEDIHSPVHKGFVWSHVTWILSKKHNETQFELVRDLVKFPELVWLNQHFLIPVVALGFLMFFTGGWSVFFWGFIVSTVFLWHGTFLVNSMTHIWGNRRYKTKDNSKNSLLIALVTMGEGWHNNHHYYMNSTRQGFFWWEIDMSYYILKTLSWFGVVHDLKAPPEVVYAVAKTPSLLGDSVKKSYPVLSRTIE